jgi:hypothetical protein
MGAALFSVYPHLLQLHLPVSDKFDHRRFFFLFPGIFIPLVVSSIFNQLASGFIVRPLELIYDLRFDSVFLVQMIGFFLCLFSSFTFGAIYASSHNANDTP